MDQEQLRETLEDLRKEQSDLEYEKELFTRQNQSLESQRDQDPKLTVQYLRPPKNSKEAIHTLQETDARFEVNKQFLVGGKGSLNDRESTEERQERQRLQVLENVPDGMTIQRLAYPVQVGNKM